MDELIQALMEYDREHYQKNEMIEVEGADFLENFGLITRTVAEIIESLIRNSYITKEHEEFIKCCQMRCIGELGEIQEIINEYE